MKENTLLLVIDMQYGMLQRDVYDKLNLIKNINNLIDFFHKENKEVILTRHTNDSYSKKDSENWKIDEELKYSNKDILFDKAHSSVFKEKEFNLLLENKKVTDLVVVGLVSNGCVQTACLEAKELGYSVTLISDAHSTFSKDAKKVIDDWNSKLNKNNITLLTTNEFIKGK